MYDDHYGLSGRPFQLTPDARFWFDTATHRKAMAYLGYGLAQGEGFIVITGEVGAGKTTLVGHLMGRIDRERLHVVQLVSTQIEAEELLRLVADGLGVASAGLTKAALLAAIERGLHAVARQGKRTLLVVDESQALPMSALEELRMLSNFQAGGHALLQIFLLGQPEFRDTLNGSERLEQLRQRVIAVHHLDAMGADEVEPYMTHRLKLVGWTGRPGFTPDAYATLFEASGGIPRRLNQLAGRVLLFGAIERLDLIDGAAVAAVLADVSRDLPTVAAAVPPAAVEPIPFATPEPVELVPAEIEAAEPMVDAAAEPLPSEPEAQEDAIEAHPAPDSEEQPPAVPDEALIARIEALEARPLAPAEPQPDPALLARLEALEARCEEQDAALRRVLRLLVDWVEGDAARPDLSRMRA